MASTYTSNTGIEKPGTGEQSGTWGDTVNTNSDILDRALNGALTLGLSGAASSLITQDGTLSPGQFKLVVFNGSPTGTHTVTVEPNNAQKIYFLYNTTGEDVVITQGSGANVTIPAGQANIVSCDGAGSSAAVTDISGNFNTGDASVSSVAVSGGTTGLTTTGGPVTTSGTITIDGTLNVDSGGTGSTTASGARTSLGVAIGTDVLAYDAGLAAIGGLSVTDGNIVVGNGSTWVAESGATARTSLGLAIGTDVLAYDSNLQSFVTAFTLPTSDGTSGQVISTNGSGTLSFSTASGATSINGLSDGYADGTSIGLGTNALENIDDTNSQNVGIGRSALAYVTTELQNTAVGYTAGRFAGGDSNTLVGDNAGYYASNGSGGGSNVGVGYKALYGASGGTGYFNVAVGTRAGISITSGLNNVVIGHDADVSSATANHEITIGNSLHTVVRFPFTVTVSGLPSASTVGAGSRSFVTDATATTFASIVAGSGSNGVPVYSDGTNWRIG